MTAQGESDVFVSDSFVEQTDTSAEDVSTAVIEAVAEAGGDDPVELDPLYDRIDPDALDALFESPPDDLVVEFSLGSYHVRIEADGRILVSERSSAGSDRPH